MQEIWCSVVKKKNQFGWNHYSEGLFLMADSKVCLLYLEINWLYNNQKKKPKPICSCGSEENLPDLKRDNAVI